MPDTVLVTGGAGFIGATLVRRLVEQGNRVRVLDNFSTGDRSYLEGVDVDVLAGDITNPDDMDRAVAGIGSVAHLAAAGSVVDSIADPGANFEVNAAGTFQVLQAARRHSVQRVVVASTGGALFGRAVPPVDERTSPSPISPYGASKLAAEGYASAFAGSYGLGTVVLRFGNVYGPWSLHKKSALMNFLRAVDAGEPIVIYGDGSASRDFVHVDDIADAIGAALAADVPGGTVLHLASGRETTLRDLADICRRAAGAPGHPVELRPRRTGEVERNFASYELAARLLRFSPSVGLENGVARTWQWMKEARGRSAPGDGAAAPSAQPPRERHGGEAGERLHGHEAEHDRRGDP